MNRPILFFLPLFAIAILTCLALPVASYAQIPETIEIQPVVGFANLSQAVNTLVTVAMFLGAIAAFAFIVLGAFQYVTSRDDANAAKSARQTITNAIIGLILLGLVYVIFTIVVRIVPGLGSVFTGL